jgi:hypothetical protein
MLSGLFRADGDDGAAGEMGSQHDAFSFCLGQLANGVQKYKDDVVHFVEIVVKEDDLIWGEQPRSQAYQLLALDLPLWRCYYANGHNDLAPNKINVVSITRVFYMACISAISIVLRYSKKYQSFRKLSYCELICYVRCLRGSLRQLFNACNGFVAGDISGEQGIQDIAEGCGMAVCLRGWCQLFQWCCCYC